jgi:hypothetical protein
MAMTIKALVQALVEEGDLDTRMNLAEENLEAYAGDSATDESAEQLATALAQNETDFITIEGLNTSLADQKAKFRTRFFEGDTNNDTDTNTDDNTDNTDNTDNNDDNKEPESVDDVLGKIEKEAKKPKEEIK